MSLRSNPSQGVADLNVLSSAAGSAGSVALTSTTVPTGTASLRPLAGLRRWIEGKPARQVSELDDMELVSLAAGGRDHAAFAELVRRHEGRVRSLLLRMSGDMSLADDLSQEVFIRAYRALGGFEGRARVSTWLYRIAYNAYVNHKTRTKVTAELDEHVAANLSDPHFEGTAGHRDMGRDINLAVAQLPENYRAAVLLYYVEDLSYPEIAEVLDLPLGTVKTHLHRAKKALREHLEGWEGSGDPCA